MEPVYLGNITVSLYGASSGVVDIGDARAAVIQADLRSNSTYKAGISMLKASSSNIGVNFSDAVAGLDFGTAGGGNQPNNDQLHVVSDDATDIGQIVTVYGTTTGTSVVCMEEMVLNGTTAVDSSKTNWGYILGVELSGVCAGTVTLQEASTDQTIITIAAAALSSGVTTVAVGSRAAYDLPARVVADGASTRTVGVVGVDVAGRTVYDAMTVAGTTAVNGVVPMHTVTKLLHGDVASGTNVTFDVGNLTWAAASATLTDGGTDDTTLTSNHQGRRYLHWCFYNATTATSGGVNDKLLVKLYG